MRSPERRRVVVSILNTNKYFLDAMAVVSVAATLPKFIVFADYNLGDYRSADDESEELRPQAMPIVRALLRKNVRVGVVLATPGNKDRLQAIGAMRKVFYLPAPVEKHFQGFRVSTGISYTSMLFFGHKERDIQAVSELGVNSVLVQDGINVDALRTGLLMFEAI